jgi:branched-chain amino acid transport system ATP-binding protein
MPPALEARNLCKDFRGFRATNDVSLCIDEGEIHAILGPNGAGKTTLFNLLSGFLAPSAGEVRFFDRPITGLAPYKVARLGLTRSFQISSVFTTLSVLDNLLVALQAATPHPLRFWESKRVLARFEPRAHELLEEVNLKGLEKRRASELSHGQKRNLEIAISLTQSPKVLLLDEPTSGMGGEDIQRTVELVKKVAKGRTVVLVEHNMGVVAQLARKITVLQYGSVLAQGSYDQVRKDPKVIEAYLGEEIV